jgi:hypothetical protein
MPYAAGQRANSFFLMLFQIGTLHAIDKGTQMRVVKGSASSRAGKSSGETLPATSSPKDHLGMTLAK